jgi:hypothetical protein
VVYDERWIRVNFPCTHSETQLHEGKYCQREERGYLILIPQNKSKGRVNHSRSRDNAHLLHWKGGALAIGAVAVKQAEVPG